MTDAEARTETWTAIARFPGEMGKVKVVHVDVAEIYGQRMLKIRMRTDDRNYGVDVSPCEVDDINRGLIERAVEDIVRLVK